MPLVIPDGHITPKLFGYEVSEYETGFVDMLALAYQAPRTLPEGAIVNQQNFWNMRITISQGALHTRGTLWNTGFDYSYDHIEDFSALDDWTDDHVSTREQNEPDSFDLSTPLGYVVGSIRMHVIPPVEGSSDAIVHAVNIRSFYQDIGSYVSEICRRRDTQSYLAMEDLSSWDVLNCVATYNAFIAAIGTAITIPLFCDKSPY